MGGKEDSLAGGWRGQQESPSPGQNYKWTLRLLSGNNVAAKSINGHKHVTPLLIGRGCPEFFAAALPAAALPAAAEPAVPHARLVPLADSPPPPLSLPSPIGPLDSLG